MFNEYLRSWVKILGGALGEVASGFSELQVNFF